MQKEKRKKIEGILMAVLICLSGDRYERAQLALQKGDDDLARDALARRKSFAVSSFQNSAWWDLSQVCSVEHLNDC